MRSGSRHVPSLSLRASLGCVPGRRRRTTRTRPVSTWSPSATSTSVTVPAGRRGRRAPSSWPRARPGAGRPRPGRPAPRPPGPRCPASGPARRPRPPGRRPPGSGPPRPVGTTRRDRRRRTVAPDPVHRVAAGDPVYRRASPRGRHRDRRTSVERRAVDDDLGHRPVPVAVEPVADLDGPVSARAHRR